MDIYDYFREGNKIYNEDNIKELTADMLDSIVLLEMSSPGAMGAGGLLLLVSEDGRFYPVTFLGVNRSTEGCQKLYATKAYEAVNNHYNGLLAKIPKGTCDDGWKSYDAGMGWFIAGKDKYFDRLMDHLHGGATVPEEFEMQRIAQHFPYDAVEVIKRI